MYNRKKTLFIHLMAIFSDGKHNLPGESGFGDQPSSVEIDPRVTTLSQLCY